MVRRICWTLLAAAAASLGLPAIAQPARLLRFVPESDIAVLDPSRRGKVRKEDLHETDYTPWEGHEVAAWPSMTILRGKIVVENGQFLANPSDGQFLPRKIPDAIRARPAL